MSEPHLSEEDIQAKLELEQVEDAEKTQDGIPRRRKMTEEQIEQLIREEKAISVRDAIKTHKRILAYCTISFLCGMTYGYDSVANGSTVAMPAFLLSFGAVDETGSLYAPSVWTSLWSSMSNAGQVVGSFTVGPVAQLIGRRYAIIVYAALSIAGTAVQFTADSRGMLLAGKIINGVTVGALLAVGTTYASEIATVRLRGPLLQTLVFFSVAMQGTSLGVVRAFVPNLNPSAWKTVFALQWVFGSLPMVAIFYPESPLWLVTKGKDEQARKMLRRLYGNEREVEIRYELLLHTYEKEKALENEQASFSECFKGPDLKRTLTIMLLMFSNGTIGAGFLAQNIYFLLTVGLPAIHSFDIGIGGFFLGAVAIVLSSIYSDRIGRRRLFLWGTFVNTLGMLIIGCLGIKSSKAIAWAIAVVMNLLISWQVFACVGVSWSMSPEISSYRLRQ
ncbi:putative MFS sugar transporter, partial [Myxozyma melibiosi]